MNTVCPQIPDTAPFDTAQRQWINGYLAGLFSGRSQAPQQSQTPNHGPLWFLWGSQTGGAERLAKQFAKQASANGFAAKAIGLDAASPADLAQQARICIITSTYGDGDMPDNAQAYWDALRQEGAPTLNGVEFAVCAMGDRSYTQFCKAGIEFDERLASLGATRIVSRVECDVDEDALAQQWFAGLMDALAPGMGGATPTAETAPSPAYDKTRPYLATLKTNRRLTGEGSAKETRHFELLLDAEGLEYEVGDALGVMPTNCPDWVAEILAAASLNGSETISLKDGCVLPLQEALLTKFDLSPFLSALPQAMSAEELVAPLRPLKHRLYSISSSPKAHPGEVHLTVGIVRYEIDGKPRKGVCSTFLADRSGGSVPVFIHRSPGFRLPANPETPVIMIGPGTGIAPFRAFLEERRATAPESRNWLFFGDQHMATDFLYQEELEAMLADGTLTHLDTAFSRDQSAKIYVQDRMMERAERLWSWLQEGAHLYVCGDASRMAKDVDAALHRIIVMQGTLTEQEAQAFVNRLKSEKRYQRDVY